MSWLEKIGLVERDESADPNEITADVLPQTTEVDAEISSAVNVVDEIYAQNELSDKSTSIFTVQALIATLPTEMTTAKKQSTVAGILAVSGKSVADLLSDAGKRVETLKAAQGKIVGDRSEEIRVAKNDIEELKRAIEAANIKIKEAEDIIAATEKSVDDEIKTITDLVEFCNGMEAAQ